MAAVAEEVRWTTAVRSRRGARRAGGVNPDERRVRDPARSRVRGVDRPGRRHDDDGAACTGQDAMRVTGVAGASLGILVGDRSKTAAAGWADVDAQVPVEPTTRFQISSVTKPMVATVVARLADRGALAYDDPVGIHVPEVVDAPWARGILIHHLLSQTHAIAAPPYLEFDIEHDGDDALAALATELATCPTMAPPGEVWSYSNCGANLLGRAIETVCSSTWEEAMRKELLEPLGMVRTGFVHEGVAAPVLGGYVAVGAWEEGDSAPDPPTWELAEPWTARPLGPGGTTVWSTADDLLRFARLHLDDGALPDGNRYCAPGSLARLRETTVAVRVPDFLDGWCSMMARWDWRGGRGVRMGRGGDRVPSGVVDRSVPRCRRGRAREHLDGASVVPSDPSARAGAARAHAAAVRADAPPRRRGRPPQVRGHVRTRRGAGRGRRRR
jgi:CubicO group peptidase (beta-lactamase class C family)